MADHGVEEELSFHLSDATTANLIAQLSRAFTEAFSFVSESVIKDVKSFTSKVAAGINQIEPAAKVAEGSLRDLNKVVKDTFTADERQVKEFTDALLSVPHSISVVVSELTRLTEKERRGSIERTQATSDAARLEIEQTRNVGRIANIEGQKAVVAARNAGKQRAIITQELMRTIGRLEKGLGATITGIAKTSTSAISKIFGSLTGVFRRDQSGIDAELRRTTGIVERGMKRTNAEFTEGVQGSLSKREQEMRSSFTRQEQIVSRSALRQEEKLAGVRASTQTGVLGAANRGLNVGAFLGGFAVLGAARSTFKIGSDFVRGLAVLQAQLGLTADQMKAVDKLSIDLGNDVSLPGVSALDAAQAIQILTKQFGFLGPTAVDAAEAAAKGTLQLSRATGASAEDAAALIGSAVNVFKVGADQAVTIADNFAGALSKAAGVGFSEFKDSFVQGASVFEEFVGPVESAKDTLLDFNTTLAVLAKNGITGSNAGAGLKQFFLQATKQSPKALELSAQLAQKVGETGNVFFQADGKARRYNDSLRILRSGLVGMTDQQRNASLATLFGSRSIIVANALVNESQADYDALHDSISKQGLAAQIAAAQNTGFAGAMDALKSVIETVQIQLFKKLNPALGAVTLGFANLLNNILNGTGAFAIVRQALLGIAIGLGAIIAAKGAVEVFGLLGKTLALATTPFGAILLTAGLLGGVISVLAKRSEPFRKALSDIATKAKVLAKIVMVELQIGLSALGGVIERDVIPFVTMLAVWVGDHLVSAFHATVRFIVDDVIPALKIAGEFIARIATVGFKAVVGFIRDEVIPGFKRFVDFTTTSLLPIAERIGGVFVRGFDRALDAIKRFWHWVEPVIRPMLNGFHDLVNAIGAIFTGQGFGDLGKGLGAAGAGIATSFTGIGKNLLGVLERLWGTVERFFKEKFSGPNLISFGKGFLDFVEFIGHALGTLITSPTFIRAVATITAGLAAAAVLIAVRFVEGFGKAFIDHIGGLESLLGEALKAVVVAVFSNPGIALAIGLAIVALLRLVSVFKSFSAMGSQAGGGFIKGFALSLKQGITSLPDFTRGLTGAGLPGTARSSGLFFKQQLIQQGTLQRNLRALGSDTQVSLNPTSLTAAHKELKLLRSGVSDATLRGLLLRDTFNQVGAAGKIMGTGLRTGLSQIVAGFKDIHRVARVPIESPRFAVSGKGVVKDRQAPSTTFTEIAGFSKGLVRDAVRGFDTIRLKGMYAADGVRGAFDTLRIKGLYALDGLKLHAKTAFGGVLDGWKIAGRTIIDGFTTLRIKGLYALDGIKATSKNAFDGLKLHAQTAFGGVLEGWRTAGRVVGDGFTTLRLKGMFAFDAVKATASKAFGGVGGVAGRLFGDLKAAGRTAFDWLKNTSIVRTATAGAQSISGAFKQGFGTIKTSFIATMEALRAIAVEQNTTLAKVIIKGVGVAAAGAATAIGGFLAGKAVGESGGSGASLFTTALLGGLTSTALFSELGAIAPVIGVVTAATTLLGGAFGAAGKKAKEFRDEVKRLAGAFTEDLQQSLKDSVIFIEDLKNHKINIGDLIELNDKARQTVIDTLTKNLSKNEKKVLISVGLSIPDTADLLAKVTRSGGTLDDFRKQWITAFFDMGKSSEDFRNKVGAVGSGISEEVSNILKKIALPGGKSTVGGFLSDSKELQGVSQQAIDILSNNRSFFDSLLSTADEVTGKHLQGIADAADTAQTDILVTAEKSDRAFQAISDHLHDFAAGLPKDSGGFGHLFSGLDPALKLLDLRKGLQEATLTSLGTFAALVKVGNSAEDANKKLIAMHLQPVDQTIVDAWKEQLDGIAQKVQVADDLVASFPGALTDAIKAANGLSGGQAVVDQAIVDSKGIATAVSDAVSKGESGAPELHLALGDLSGQIATVISAGLSNHTINPLDPASVDAAIKPLRDAVFATLDPSDPNYQKTYDTLTLFFANSVKDLQPTLSAEATAIAAAKFQADVQAYMLANPFTTEVTADFIVKINSDKDFNQNFLQEGDLRRFGVPKGQSALAKLLPSAADVKALTDQATVLLQPAGTQVSRGFAIGIGSAESLRLIADAVKKITDAALRNANTNLKIKSPSQVAHEMGGYFSQGFANGITAGAEAAAAAARGAAQGAVDAANAVITTSTPIKLPIGSSAGAGLKLPPHAQGLSATNPAIGASRGFGTTIIAQAQLGTQVNPGDDTAHGALTTAQIIAIGRAIAADVRPTEVTINESQAPRATARAVVNEIRTQTYLVGRRS